MKCLVTGAGGFIAGHLVQSLVDDSFEVVAVDLKPRRQWFQLVEDATNVGMVDLRKADVVEEIFSENFDVVFNLAADMGGIGYIEHNKALCMLSSVINTNLLLQCIRHPNSPARYFYASSACVYAADRQKQVDAPALKEEDAYPAMPEDGYGWEKLFSERMCTHFREDFGVPTRIARFHNVYGPQGEWRGGREKAPAAICRKIARASLFGRDSIEIWGDGEQTRSFMYVDDCVFGVKLITFGNYAEPLNLGSSESVSINQLVDLIEEIAGVKLHRHYNLDAPKGVRGRNSDNTRILKEYDWEPSTALKDGLEVTYRWIFDQLARSNDGNEEDDKVQEASRV